MNLEQQKTWLKTKFNFNKKNIPSNFMEYNEIIELLSFGYYRPIDWCNESLALHENITVSILADEKNAIKFKNLFNYIDGILIEAKNMEHYELHHHIKGIIESYSKSQELQ